MAEGEIRTSLLRLYRRGEAARLADRLLAYGLWSLALYFLLMAALVLLDYSMLAFHLGLYLSLSLLPLFLLVGGSWGSLGLLRRLDDNCQLEAYLATSSAGHRRFMAQRVMALLERRRTEAAMRFRPGRLTRLLALAAAAALLLFLGFSYLKLDTLTAGLSPRGLKELLAARAAAEGPPPEAERPEAEALLPGGRREQEEPAQAEETPALAVERTQPGEAPPPDLEQAGAQGRPLPPRESGLALAEEWEQTAEPSQGRPLIEIPGEPQDLRSLLQEGVRRPAGAPVEGAGSAAGSGDSGRALRESPLREYSTVPQSAAAPGGRDLSAAASLAERREEALRRALFGDFLFTGGGAVDFDPRLESVKRRFLELYDERF